MVTIEMLLREISRMDRIPYEELMARRRTRPLARRRQAVMLVASVKMRRSHETIARALGLERSSVTHGIRGTRRLLAAKNTDMIGHYRVALAALANLRAAPSPPLEPAHDAV